MTDINDRFSLLDCDDDVLLFYERTFKLSTFRKLLNQEFSRKLNQYSQNDNFGLFSFSVEGISVKPNNINWKSTIINCEILKLGYKSWQSGKLRIQVNLEEVDVPSTRHNSRRTTKEIKIQQVCLDFCPDKPEFLEISVSNNSEINQPESPLDDIRKMMNGNS